MTYPYITENNLVNQQHYMYSKYEGISFLKEFEETRRACLNSLGNRSETCEVLPSLNGLRQKLIEDYVNCENATSDCLGYDEIDTNSFIRRLTRIALTDELFYENKQFLHSLDEILKSFEVRKRLYAAYTLDFKPSSTDFGNIENYALASFLFGVMYTSSKRLKYLNAQLKINDTLISVSADPQLTSTIKELLCLTLMLEISNFRELCMARGIVIE